MNLGALVMAVRPTISPLLPMILEAVDLDEVSLIWYVWSLPSCQISMVANSFLFTASSTLSDTAQSCLGGMSMLQTRFIVY
jgi:hypothetical protein